jgi:hypothetical protein
MKAMEEAPTPLPDPCLMTNNNVSVSLDDSPDPDADLKSISRSVLVDSPAAPNPVAVRGAICIEVTK